MTQCHMRNFELIQFIILLPKDSLLKEHELEALSLCRGCRQYPQEEAIHSDPFSKEMESLTRGDIFLKTHLEDAALNLASRGLGVGRRPTCTPVLKAPQYT